MQYYPINLNIADRDCAVIGGGPVAERKVAAIADCGAKVTVISPDLTAGLAEMAAAGSINHIAEEYRSEIMTSFFLIICATDDHSINNKAAEEAKQQGILVNVVDGPNLCDFIVPAIVDRGDLTIAISTSGKSPALARLIKQQLAALYGEEYAAYTELLAEFRQKIKEKCSTSREREQLWQKTDMAELLALLKSGKLKDAEDMILNAANSNRT